MGKESFVFYKSFYEAIKKLKKRDQLTLYSHICQYALGEKVDGIEGVPAAIFDLIKPQIDANLRRYENGLKGGRPKTEREPKHNQAETKAKRNVNVNENVNVNDNVNVNAPDGGAGANTHTIPTVDDVVRRAPMITTAEAQRFIDYNAATGWKVEWTYALERWLERLEKKEQGSRRPDRDPKQREGYKDEINWNI